MKSNHNYKKGIYFFCIIFFAFIASCSKMNDLHDVYLRRGETIYVGKPDSVIFFAGKKRVKLRYWESDPKAAKLAVYWLSRTDSIILDIPPHLAKDSVEVIIPNLPEYSYSFELITMNKDYKNRSVPFQSSGNSYGDNFQSNLTNRGIKYTANPLLNKLTITWIGAVEKGIGTEVVYVNKDGDSEVKFVPMSEKSTVINDWSREAKYRTLFLPEPSAIDTFYTEFKTINP